MNLRIGSQVLVTVKDCYAVLSAENRRKLGLMVMLQALLSILDLIGVAIVGVIAALSVNGVRSLEPGQRVSSVLKLLNLESLAFQTQTVLLGVFAAAILVLKTIFSVKLTRKSLHFLGRISAEVSEKLIKQLLNTSIVFVRNDTTQRTLYLVTDGVSAITIGIVGSFAAALVDVSLLLILGMGIGFFDPLLALIALFSLSIILITIHRRMRNRMIKLSEETRNRVIESSELIVEILQSYREAYVRNRRSYYAKRIALMRKDISQLSAEQVWIPNISKYAIEITVTLGTVIIAGLQFLTKDAPNAVGGLAIFLAAASRMAPALLRIQQNAIAITNFIATAKPTLDLFEKLQMVEPLSEEVVVLNTEHVDFSPDIMLKNVSFSYSGDSNFALKDVSLEIPAGTSIAIVGPSGAGKSTLVDLLLGVLEPTQGEVLVSKMKPTDAIERFPGAISYVPQDTSVFNGTIKSNITLGFDDGLFSEELVNNAINRSNLREFVSSLPDALNTLVGERGSKLSGGQRQRLGIARALVTKPKLLVLDEATSSLDGKSEYEVTESLKLLQGDVTVILIAHRLSTLRDVDLVLYLEDGEIKGMGNFEFVRATVPNFDNQARLMGL